MEQELLLFCYNLKISIDKEGVGVSFLEMYRQNFNFTQLVVKTVFFCNSSSERELFFFYSNVGSSKAGSLSIDSGVCR